jgi:hypothetical protein
MVVPFKYDYVERFAEDLAAVRRLDRWGFVNRSGQLVIPLKYDYVGQFSNGLTFVVLDGQRGYIGRDGTEYFEP